MMIQIYDNWKHRTEIPFRRLTVTITVEHEKAIAELNRMKSWRVPNHKRWRGVGHFDVPGVVMWELAASGICERRKLSGSSPAEYRP